MAVTGLADQSSARDILASHDWNCERAIDAFLGGGGGSPPVREADPIFQERLLGGPSDFPARATDPDLQRVLEESRAAAEHQLNMNFGQPAPLRDDDEELQRAIAQSCRCTSAFDDDVNAAIAASLNEATPGSAVRPQVPRSSGTSAGASRPMRSDRVLSGARRPSGGVADAAAGPGSMPSRRPDMNRPAPHRAPSPVVAGRSGQGEAGRVGAPGNASRTRPGEPSSRVGAGVARVPAGAGGTRPPVGTVPSTGSRADARGMHQGDGYRSRNGDSARPTNSSITAPRSSNVVTQPRRVEAGGTRPTRPTGLRDSERTGPSTSAPRSMPQPTPTRTTSHGAGRGDASTASGVRGADHLMREAQIRSERDARQLEERQLAEVQSRSAEAAEEQYRREEEQMRRVTEDSRRAAEEQQRRQAQERARQQAEQDARDRAAAEARQREAQARAAREAEEARRVEELQRLEREQAAERSRREAAERVEREREEKEQEEREEKARRAAAIEAAEKKMFEAQRQQALAKQAEAAAVSTAQPAEPAPKPPQQVAPAPVARGGGAGDDERDPAAVAKEVVAGKVRQLTKAGSPEAVKRCVTLVRTYIINIAQNPLEPKFRSINTANKAFQERVAPFEVAREILQAVGFQADGEKLVLQVEGPLPRKLFWDVGAMLDIVAQRLA